MSQKEKNSYILGTEKAELHRLGLQHQVWASEAREGWDFAGFGEGQIIMDLGSGPGFCSRDLAYIVGPSGKVIAVDKSKTYIDFLKKTSALHDLNIEAVCSDFDDMVLEDTSLDGVYCRWAMAWIANPEEIIAKIKKALKPGGVIVMHEYYDWSVLQTQPVMSNLKKCIAAALKSFKEQDGDIDIGKRLPEIFFAHDLEVVRLRPMSKISTPSELTWQWPKSFFKIYFPKLIEAGFLDKEVCQLGLEELEALSYVEVQASVVHL
jgi:ubiquinone/menaquinone biosynthesis C-methylase UbiE